MQKLEEEAQGLETEGWGKLKEAIAGLEAEGFFGLLRGVTSYSLPLPSQPPLEKPHPAPVPPFPNHPLGSQWDLKSPILQIRPHDLPLQLLL